MKEETGKKDFIKIKNFCLSKDTLKKMSKQPTRWEKKNVKQLLTNNLTANIRHYYKSIRKDKQLNVLKMGKRLE